jgi:hypothetical protein
MRLPYHTSTYVSGRSKLFVALISAGAKTVAATGTIETRIEYQIVLRVGVD